MTNIYIQVTITVGFPDGASGKEPTASAEDIRDSGSIPGLGRFPWKRAWQPTPVFLPGESHGQRSLATVHGVTNSRT